MRRIRSAAAQRRYNSHYVPARLLLAPPRRVCQGVDGARVSRYVTTILHACFMCGAAIRELQDASPGGINLVCRYARSLGLAARQNTPAIDGAFYCPNGTSYQLQTSFHTNRRNRSHGPLPRAGEEFY